MIVHDIDYAALHANGAVTMDPSPFACLHHLHLCVHPAVAGDDSQIISGSSNFLLL